MEREGGFGLRMQEPSQVWGDEREMECIKSDDDAHVSSLGSRSNINSNSTALYSHHHHHIVKPLLNGFLTGQLQALVHHCLRSIFLHLAQADPYFKKTLPDSFLKIPSTTLLRREMVLGATHATASLGMFEILTKKLRKANNGMPLTLHQEACCGLTSGATSAFAWQPFMLAENRVGLQNLTYRNWFTTLSHIARNEGFLTLWRGSGWYIGTQAVTQMGMLASYNRSLNYFIESKGLSVGRAQISAGIISGFFTSFIFHPCGYLKQIKDVVQMKYDGGEKNAYRNIPHYISRILTPYSGSEFYIRFLKCFHANAVFCMMRWWIFEQIRTAEEPTQDLSTPDCQNSSYLGCNETTWMDVQKEA